MIRAAALIFGLIYAMGCTTTVVDKSAQASDPDERFDQQLARAGRFHRRGLNDSAIRQYDAAVRPAQGFATDDPRRIAALTQRAELRLALNDYAGAESDYRAIIEAERLRARGRPSLELSNALNNLAVFLIDLQRIADSEELLREAIDHRIAIYGDEHPVVAALVQNLADAERRIERYDVSETLFLRALSIYSQSGPDYYRQASIAQNGLARVYAATDRFDDAEKNHLDAIRLSIKAGGETNPDVGVFSRDLANLYSRQGRTDEAEVLYKGSIAIFRDTLGENSYQISRTYRAYSEMLASVGRRRESRYFEARAEATGY